MLENLYTLERLSARRQIENAIEAHRDHVGAAVARATNQRRARLQGITSLFRVALLTWFGIDARTAKQQLA